MPDLPDRVSLDDLAARYQEHLAEDLAIENHRLLDVLTRLTRASASTIGDYRVHREARDLVAELTDGAVRLPGKDRG